MGKPILPLILLAAACAALHPARAESGLAVMADERRPHAWRENGIPQGICYELVVETMKELKLKPEVEFTSFVRGLHLAQTEKNVAFFSVTPTPERDQLFKWVGPLVRSDVYIYKLRENPLTIRTLDDLRRQTKIGVPRGMKQDTTLSSEGYKVMRFDNITKTLLALANRRADVIAIGELTLHASAREAGLDPALFEQTPLKLYENPLYIAFSKDVSDETIQRWQKALDKVKREKYSQLDHKYLH